MMIRLGMVWFSLSVFITYDGYGQNAFYDALELRNYITVSRTDTAFDNLSRQNVFSVLVRYDENLDANSAPDEILQAYRNRDNRYILDYISNLSLSSPALTESTFDFGIPSMNITSIAEGLTGFIISRTKKELNAAFFRGFKKRLDESEEFRILFPQTLKALNAIGEQIYNFNAYIKLLRESFHKDLSSLFANLPYLLDQPFLDKAFEDNPELEQLIKSSIAIIRSLSNNEHPASVIHKIAVGQIQLAIPGQNTRVANRKLQESIRVLDLFSESLRSQKNDRYWVSTDSLQQLLEPVTFQIYLGLVYQQVSGENPLGLGDALQTIARRLGQSQNAIREYKNYIAAVLERAGQVDLYLKALNDKSTEERSYRDYHTFYTSTVRLLETSSRVFELPGIAVTDDVKAASRNLLFFTESIGDIYLDINEQRYSSAIVNFEAVYDRLITTIAAGGDPGGGFDHDQRKDFVKQFLKYGAFMASVVEAGDGEEVEQVIESFALPPGSYRIKRESRFSISLNSYLGGFSGREYLEDEPGDGKGIWGLTAPVGFAFSAGLAGGKSDVTLFVSLVDVGGVASFRFEHDEEEELPELTLQNIIAPGINLYFGIPGTPLVAGGGAQRGPQARQIPVDGILSENSGWRWNILVGVDIPILNLFANPR